MIKKLIAGIGGAVTIIGGIAILAINVGTPTDLNDWKYNDLRIIVSTLGDTTITVLVVPDSIRDKGKRRYKPETTDNDGRKWREPDGWAWVSALKVSGGKWQWEKYRTVKDTAIWNPTTKLFMTGDFNLRKLALIAPASITVPTKILQSDARTKSTIAEVTPK